MTKEEFLDDPLRFLEQDGANIPLDWVKDAWSKNDHFHWEVVDDLVQSVSKSGNFFHARGWLELLSSALPCPEAVVLFASIRERVVRPEREWRPEFERAFPGCVPLLPEFTPDEPGFHDMDEIPPGIY